MTRNIAAVVALALISLPVVLKTDGVYAAGNLDFGGTVTYTEECNDGMLLTLEEPQGGTEYLMWQYGELPYATYSEPHIGQNMIGEASYVTSECYLGDDYIGYGYPIQFHGESE